MVYREFGRTGWKVSEIGFGAWAIGGSWGDVPEDDAIAALNAALDSGVNFIDTADVYGDGRSERLIRRVVSSRSDRVYIATKAGRRLSPHSADGYTADNLNAFIDRSLDNLGVDSIDLLQLHCPPTDVYYRPEVFAALDDIVAAGKVRYYGVSVEKVEEAIKAIEYPNVASVQIIFNMFRQRPAELFFHLAMDRTVAILPRVPLASGLLSGKMSRDTEFASDDHRSFNREGQAFDRGETFAGVPYEVGLDAVDELRRIKPAGLTMAQFALRWILQFDAVTVTIPGAKNVDQATRNAEASGMATIDTETLDAVREIYRDSIAPHVHHRW